MSTFPELEAWGFDPSSHQLGDPAAEPARVLRVDRGRLFVVTERGPGFVPRPPPEAAVGDFVELRSSEDREHLRWIRLLPRRNALSRRSAGRASASQILASNLDHLFIVTAFGPDLSPRRIERYASLAREAGVHPVLILNKRDLAGVGESDSLGAIRRDLRCIEISALEDDDLSPLFDYLEPRRTIALVGSSGVGKSTLINRLLEAGVLETSPVRVKDGTGRHTTTRRELLRLPSGAMVIDTPGLREVGLDVETESVEETFGEIVAWACQCRFSDCTHREEPGCAVQAAVHSGELSAERLRSFLQLRREAAGEARRRDEHLRRQHERALHRTYERHQRDKRRHRGD